MLNRLNRKSRGFTLIELLVVILILAILMAVALPLYLNSVTNAEIKTCRTNMQSIANALQANHVNTRATSYPAAGTAVTQPLVPDMQVVPKCPNLGNYTIEAGTSNAPFDVKCSVAAHGTVEAFVSVN